MKKDPNVFFDRNSFYSSHKNLNQFGTSKQHVCQLGVSIITTILKAFETFNPRKALSTDENTCGARAKNNKLDQSGKTRLVSHIFRTFTYSNTDTFRYDGET